MKKRERHIHTPEKSQGQAQNQEYAAQNAHRKNGPAVEGNWKTIPLTVCPTGLVSNEREQYSQWESLRELINNHYDAGATEVRIEVKDREIRISGNGMQIEDVQVLTELFTDNKRKGKDILDVDGKPRRMIGEKGRGRFAFVRDADELIIRGSFGEFKLEVLEDGSLSALVREGDCYIEGGRTECTLRRKQKTFDAARIRRYVESTYRLFGGKNFEIYLDNEKVAMKAFRSDFEMWVIPCGCYLYGCEDTGGFDWHDHRLPASVERLIPSRNGLGSGFLVLPNLDVLKAFDKDAVEGLISKGEVRRVAIDFNLGGWDSDILFTSGNIPVTSSIHGILPYACVKTTIESEFALEPSRKGFANPYEFGQSADRDFVKNKILFKLAEKAFREYVQENYVEHGWDKYHERRTAEIIGLGLVVLPKLQLKVKRHSNHAVRTEMKTVEELAELTREKHAVVYFTDQPRGELDLVDRLIQKGHLGIELLRLYKPGQDSNPDQDEITLWDFFESNSIRCTCYGDAKFTYLAEKYCFQCVATESKNQEERRLIKLAKKIAGMVGHSNITFQVGSVSDYGTTAFIESNRVVFNRNNYEIAEMLKAVRRNKGKNREVYLLLKFGNIVMSELAHARSERMLGGEGLEHERTINEERELYVTFLEELGNSGLLDSS